MDGGQGGVGLSCPPRDDLIGDRRSAATGCFTSTGFRFLAEIHDRPLQECGQAEGTVCVNVYACVCVQKMRVGRAQRVCSAFIRVFMMCVATLEGEFVLHCCCPNTLKPGWRADT